MESRYLREFIALAERGNFNEAADDLFISQSSLSKHMRLLESDLGTVLLIRTNRGVQLNEKGRAFLKTARLLVAAEEKGRQELTALGAPAANVITCATEYERLDDLIAGFLDAWPGQYVVNLIPGAGGSAKELLRKGLCEVAFARHVGANEVDLFSSEFGYEVLHVLMSAAHPLAGRGSLSLEDLREESFIQDTYGSVHSENMLRLCQQHGFSPRVTAYASGATASGLVRRGMGVQLLFEKPVSFAGDPGLRLVRIEPEVFVVGGVCRLRSGTLSLGAQRLVQYAISWERKTGRQRGKA